MVWRDVVIALVAGTVGAVTRHYVGAWLDRRDRDDRPPDV